MAYPCAIAVEQSHSKEPSHVMGSANENHQKATYRIKAFLIIEWKEVGERANIFPPLK